MKPQNPLLKTFALFVFIVFIVFFVSYKSGSKLIAYEGKDNLPEFSDNDASVNIVGDTAKKKHNDTIRAISTYIPSSKSGRMFTEVPLLISPKMFKKFSVPSVQRWKTKTSVDSVPTSAPGQSLPSPAVKPRKNSPAPFDTTNKH